MDKLYGKKDTINNILKYVQAGFSLLYLYSTEETKTMGIIQQVFNEIDEVKDVFIFDVADGLKWYSGNSVKSEKYKKELDLSKRDTLSKALNYIMLNVKSSFIVFKDMHNFFQSDPHLARTFKNILNENVTEDKGKERNYFFLLSSIFYIPPELEKDIVLIDIPLPTKKEIEEIIGKLEESKNIGEILKNRFIEALNGLTETEITNILYYCIVDNGKLDENDIEIIISQKQQLIRKGGSLEFVKIRELFDDIGGLKNLKEWIEKKKMIFDKYEKAIEHGVDVPKGVLFYGMPGCGKSMAAKAIATKFEMPLLRLDMGLILGSYLGQSEENIRKAIKLAESIAPSVLWIDELEKVFVGMGDSQGRGSETTTRVFGTILTWMQEKTKPVFVVATANDISGMPPEFMRKGRFDEVFFIDFPNKNETIEIFQKQLKKRLIRFLHEKNTEKEVEQIIKKIEFDQIASKMKEYSGADIEAMVKEIIEDAFINDYQNITTEIFMNKLKDFKPSSRAMAKRIKELREKAEEYESQKAS